ncbi:NAD(P)H-binding protein [Acidocella sp.]|uniref:NAD(P)H-binding protein n=1 Tax=Acidocella sp. TaxID=50710 RepID=UPI003CFC48D0
MSPTPRLLVTGAAGQLGQLTVQALLARLPAAEIAVSVRKPQDAERFTAQGITAHIADYTNPASLDAAFAGIERLLLISSNALGQRVEQHRNVVVAAMKAGVQRLHYTSVLHADASSLGLAEEHRQTEALITTSGMAFVLLRNGWYTENYAAGAKTAVQHGVLLGAAGDGRIAAAARADYAEAAAMTMLAAMPAQIYELAGDTSFTLKEFAAEISRLSGTGVAYENLDPAAYETVLKQAGLPAGLANLLADSDAAASQGALFDDHGALGKLLGRAPTPWRETLASALG